jgi:hypothetical protein
MVETTRVEAAPFVNPLLPFLGGEAVAYGQDIHWGGSEVVTAIVGQVQCGKHGGMGYHSGH